VNEQWKCGFDDVGDDCGKNIEVRLKAGVILNNGEGSRRPATSAPFDHL
jgi:hypothetical protein